jgi:hypothetical protein
MGAAGGGGPGGPEARRESPPGAPSRRPASSDTVHRRAWHGGATSLLKAGTPTAGLVDSITWSNLLSGLAGALLGSVLGSVVAIWGSFRLADRERALRRAHTATVLRAELDRLRAELGEPSTPGLGDHLEAPPLIETARLHRLVEGMIVHGAEISPLVIQQFLVLDGYLAQLDTFAEPAREAWREREALRHEQERAAIARASNVKSGLITLEAMQLELNVDMTRLAKIDVRFQGFLRAVVDGRAGAFAAIGALQQLLAERRYLIVRE